MISSLASQSYCAWKLLVVDNNSTDSSVEIVRAWQRVDSRVHLVRFPQTVSVHENFARAFHLALSNYEADYVQILAGDDYIVENDYFKTALKLLNELNSDFVIGQVADGNNSDQTVGRFSFLGEPLSRSEMREFACDNYWTCHLIYAVFRRTVFKSLVESRVAKFTRNLSSDWWFSLEALTNFRGVHAAGLTYWKHSKQIDYNSEHYRGRKSSPFASFLRKAAFSVFQLGDRFFLLSLRESLWFLGKFTRREIRTLASYLRPR
jgi:glycosyltransferase involved in cell wall biosynthesis